MGLPMRIVKYVVNTIAAALLITAFTGLRAQTITGLLPTSSFVDTIYPVGADSTGVADSRAAIQAAANAAITTGKQLVIPSGTYSVSSPGLVFSGPIRVIGQGDYGTTIKASATGYTVLTVGDGASDYIGSTGYIRDLNIVGDYATLPSSPNGFSCLNVSGQVQYEVDSINVSNCDVGYDLTDNSYGTQYTNLRGGFSGGNALLNVGINLRAADQSGSDISFYNPWVQGKFCGVCITGNANGFHFYGGQISAHETSATDGAGSVIVGYDYETAAVAATGLVDFHGTSFEGTQNVWFVRGYGQTFLRLYDDQFQADQAAAALGVYKNTNAGSGSVTFSHAYLGGTFSGASLLVDSGGFEYIDEHETVGTAEITINGTAQFAPPSMCIQSGITNMTARNQNGTYTPSENILVSGSAPTATSGWGDLYVNYPAYEFEGAPNGTFGVMHRTAASVSLTGQHAAISTATICAAGTCQAGQYHVHVTMTQTGTACSSVTTGTAVPSLTWVDDNGVTHSAVIMQMLQQTSATATAMASTGLHFETANANAGAYGDWTITTNGSNINYAVAYTACSTGTGTFSINIALGRVQ